MWNRMVFVSNLYEPVYKSHFSAGMQNNTKLLLTAMVTYIYKWAHNNLCVSYNKDQKIPYGLVNRFM